MSADDLREMRTDIKSLLTEMATIKAELKEAIPPCIYFKQHIEEHAKSRSAFGWVLGSIVAPILTTIGSVWLMLRYGMKP